MIKPCTKSIYANETVTGPRFNFNQYKVGDTYHNDGMVVDFVTDGNDLYVCAIDEVTVTAPNIKDQPNLIKLISKGVDGQRGPQGAQGRPGHSPKITAKFDGKQMVIYADGNRIAVTNDLTGPSWKPERQGNTIVWNRTKDDEQPAAIDLKELRAEDYKPVLFRVDSDNTKRSDEESGPARFIQWKYEGEENWTNLISIAELMNLTLAGVSTWRSELDGEWHLGHREVLRAKYESTATGKKIISHVELGEVLFDAGPILPDFEQTIALLEARMDGLEDELQALRLEIPTKVSAFENDVPYLTEAKAASTYQPKGNYLEGPLKTINNESLLGNGDLSLVKGVQVNDGDINYPENGIVKLTIESQSLDGVVKSVTIDGVTKTPDSDGNVSFTLGDKYNLFDLVYRNGHLYKTVNGTETDLGEFGSSTTGLEDIEFQVVSGKLQFRKKENGTFGSWEDIMSISAGGDGEHIELKIENGTLYIKYNDGEFEPVGSVGSGSGSGDTVNGFVNVSINGSVLTFTRQDGTTKDIQLPTSAGGTGITEAEAKALIGQILEGVLDDAIPEYVRQNGHNYFIRIDELNNRLSDYYTKAEVDAKIAGGGSGGGSSTGSVTIADLTNEIDPVPVNDSNIVQTTMTFTTTGRMWRDGQELTVTSITTTYSKSGVHVTTNGANCTIVVDEAVVLDSTQEIWFNITADGTTRQVAYKLVPIKALSGSTYGLIIDPTAIVIDKNGNYSVDKINVNTYWLDNGEIKTLAGWDSPNENMSSWKVWYYVDDSETGTRYTTNSNLNLDFIRTINKQIRFELRFSAGTNTTVIDIETIPVVRDGADGSDGDSVSITTQTRYYKASNQATGITAPASNLNPTLPENGSWLTSSNDIVLDSTNAYLWMFERINYSNGTVWQSDPVVIRFFNDEVNVDYDTLANEVRTKIADDLNAANDRITATEGRLDNIDSEITGINTTTDSLNGRVTAVEARTVYDDEDIKALAEVVVDAKKASIVAEADANTNEKINTVNTTLNALDGRITSTADSLNTITGDLNTVKADLNAAEAKIELAATKSELNGAISNARTEWNAADAAITSTVYTKTQTDEMMSAIEQKADKISLVVGEGKLIDENTGNVRASVVVDSINGGEVTIDANKINLLGETIATAINAAEISADQITTGTLNANRIASNSITADKLAANALTANSINTSAGSNGVSTKIQEGIFEISGCSNAKIAFGIDENCVPYMYLTDANGNEIWRATNQGFKFSGTVVPQSVQAYPSNGDLLKSITITDGKISPYSLTYTNSDNSFKYDKSNAYQYYVIRPGFVINASTYNRPDVRSGGGIATDSSKIIGYFSPGYYTSKLVDFNDVTIRINSTNVSLDAFIFRNASNMCNPSSLNSIYDGYYISTNQISSIENGLNDRWYTQGNSNYNIRFNVPVIHIINGHIDAIESFYYYPDESAWHAFEGSEININDIW